MASSRALLLVAVLLLLLLLMVSSLCVRAEGEAAAGEPALTPDIAAGRVPQGAFHEAPAAAPGTGRAGPDVGKNGAARWRRTVGRRGRGGGTGAWAFSAMLPRGFVPPSGSSVCHNDMPASEADAQFFMCGGDGSP